MSVDVEPTVARPATKSASRPKMVQHAAVLHSWTLPAPLLDPLSLFHAGRGQDVLCCYWEQPADDLVMVGIGAAYEIDVSGPSRFREVKQTWTQLCNGAVIKGGALGGPRLLGGFAFDADSSASAMWDGFPSGRLTLPRLLYTRHGTEATLTCNAMLPAGAAAGHARLALEAGWAAISAAAVVSADECRPAVETAGYGLAKPAFAGYPAQPTRACLAHHRRDFLCQPPDDIPQANLEELPDAATWKALVGAAAQTMQAGDRKDAADALQKVVLARAVRLRARERFDPGATLGRLRAGSPRFLFAFSSGRQCFLGATPERLARLQAGRVETAAVAGSRPRGVSNDEDGALTAELLRSAKDRWEHDVVAQAVARALRTVGVAVPAVPEPSVLRLPTVQHLCTPFAGTVSDGTTILDLVERLHPTPAVGGAPRQLALDWLRANEGLDRGWYAGPVGWLDAAGDGEFAVAIRSALLSDTEATVFAGCGIVAESDPDAEYDESCLKLRPMLAALGSER